MTRPYTAIWAVGGCKHSHCVIDIYRHHYDNAMSDSFIHPYSDKLVNGYVSDSIDRLSSRGVCFPLEHNSASCDRIMIDNAHSIRIGNRLHFTSDSAAQMHAGWQLHHFCVGGRSKDKVLKRPYWRLDLQERTGWGLSKCAASAMHTWMGPWVGVLTLGIQAFLSAAWGSSFLSSSPQLTMCEQRDT